MITVITWREACVLRWSFSVWWSLSVCLPNTSEIILDQAYIYIRSSEIHSHKLLPASITRADRKPSPLRDRFLHQNQRRPIFSWKSIYFTLDYECGFVVLVWLFLLHGSWMFVVWMFTPTDPLVYRCVTHSPSVSPAVPLVYRCVPHKLRKTLCLHNVEWTEIALCYC